MTNQATVGSVEEYIAGFPPATQRVLEELRALIRSAAPDATERISYAIPTFYLNGRYLVYLAGWKKHVALYPITAGIARAFAAEIEPYQSGKGSLRFPLAQPMPTELIRRIIELRVDEITADES